MSSTQDLIARYEAIADTSGQMLTAARNGEWDRFTDLENDCAHMIEELRRRSPATVLDAAGKRARMHALRRVIAADAQIRVFTEPEIDRLGSLLRLAPPDPSGG